MWLRANDAPKGIQRLVWVDVPFGLWNSLTKEQKQKYLACSRKRYKTIDLPEDMEVRQRDLPVPSNAQTLGKLRTATERFCDMEDAKRAKRENDRFRYNLFNRLYGTNYKPR